MSAADAAIQYALAQVGKPYKWGATGPDSFDCSGLVMMAYKAGGIDLPRTTYQQVLKGTRVASKAALLPGDLVFPDPGHVQIFLGNGKVVEAPRTGKNVQVVNMWGFWTARRVAAAPAQNPYSVNTAGFSDCYTFVPNPIGGGMVPVPNGKCKDLGLGSIPGVPDIGAVWGALTGMLDAFRSIGEMLSWITQPGNWLRIGEFAVGVMLLLMGTIGLERVGSIVKTTGKVAASGASS